MAWPPSFRFRVTPDDDAPDEMRHVFTVRVYAPSRPHARNTLRVLAIVAARRYA